jgi:hypothetical protein
VAKAASLIAIVIGGYDFAHGQPGAKKALAGVAAGTGIAVLVGNVLSWLWGVLRPAPPSTQRLDENLIPDKARQNHRTNRVFESLHKPLTYVGVERTLFCSVCVGAVGAFNLFKT